MIKLKKLFLYRECSYTERDTFKPSIEDNKFVLSESIADRVVEYLESGKILFEFVSPTTDPYNECDFIPNKILSDGTYVWDGVVINWVRKYKIRLPISFLEHVDRTMKNPQLIADLDVALLIQQLSDGVEELYVEEQ
jgi:hypothetical protein